MQRRAFIKGSTILATIVALSPSFSFASESKNPFGITSKPRKFSITNSFSIAPSNEETKLWVPLPLESDYQKLVNVDYKGNFKEAKIATESVYGAKVLFVSWDKGTDERKLDVKFDVVTTQRTIDFSKAKSSVSKYTDEVAFFLKPSEHIPVNEKAKKLATEIIGNAKTDLEKAKAIYDWTVKNMYRDESVKGCGPGDAMRTIEDKVFGGKCTDISSVFVALLRNVGIPAREVFGIRAGKSYISKSFGKADDNGFADVTGGQHCRAEFYLGGLGWVPADPADVTKVRLQEKLTDEDQKVKDVKVYLFGSWEMNWVAFNYARDFVLNPKPQQFPLNMLGYPYAEVGEDPLDYYDYKAFKYSYSSQEVK